MNVTALFRLDAFACAIQLSEWAQLAGAVSALKFEGDQVLADNFDGVSLVRNVVQSLSQPLAGERILLQGAGGAALGMLLPFLAEQPTGLVLVNRAVTKALVLVRQVAGRGTIIGVGYGGGQPPG